MPDFALELACRDAGHSVICGVDEAGRGPWAGPVVAAAAVLDSTRLAEDLLSSIDDSKKLSAQKREILFARFDRGIKTGIGQATVSEIDRLNILQATMLAMKRAVFALDVAVDFALIDGNRTPDLPGIETQCVVRGDGLSLSIAAASIAAKVTRDKIMADLSRRYPGYGWEKNAGYGTRAHQSALSHLGITPEHRKSFAPIRKILRQEP